MYTKIVATLGPSTDKLTYLNKLLDKVDGVRINMSHATKDELALRLKAVRAYEKASGRPIAVIADLRGPSIRTGLMEPLQIPQGARVAFRLADKGEGFIPIPKREFFRVVEAGDEILMLDGKLVLKVVEASADAVLAEALSSGVVSSNKAVVVRGKDFDLELPVEEDLAALRTLSEFKDDIDYVALSLLKNGAEASLMKKVVYEHGLAADVMAKIETKGAVDRIEEIMDAVDYVVVARGDLALHYGLEKIPKVQRELVERAISRGKPVAVATQLLDSMQTSPTPTRAEVNDVYTTASLGVDSLWLTNETASGNYPVESVEWLARVASQVESYYAGRPAPQSSRDRFAKAVADMAMDLNADIVVYTMSGTLAKRIAKFRPLKPIYAGTSNWRIARKLALVWGVEPVVAPAETYEKGLEALMKRFEGRMIVATYGLRGGVHTIKLSISD
nr:MAG: pyruvate kinase [Thermoproteus sp. AZ2]